METGRTEKHSTPSAGNQAQAPSGESVKAICRWAQVFGEHFQREVSDLAMMAYIEGLKDLTPEQIQFCCERALQEVDRMPTVAHIRKKLYDERRGERPAYLDEAPLSEEDRIAALEYSQKLRERLAIMEEESAKPVAVTSSPSPHFLVFHEAYLLWLRQEEMKDENLRKEGKPPLPRSDQERLAIFYNMPLAERNRMRRKAEWTRVSTRNT
jgi:hypothetical protein